MDLVSLDQPCLERIVRYLDYGSFHSLLLTCKRFHSLLDSFLVWNNSILYQKAIYLLHRFILCAENMKKERGDVCHQRLLATLSDIVTKALRCNEILKAVIPSKIIETWNKCGPVFGKLHSLVDFHEKKEETSEQFEGPWGGTFTSCVITHRFTKFALPSGKDLEILYSEFVDGSRTLPYEEATRVAIGTCRRIFYYANNEEEFLKSSTYWKSRTRFDGDGVTQSRDLEYLDPLGKALEEEIGETEKLRIDGHILKLFGLGFPHFPHTSLCTNLNGEVMEFKNKEANILNEEIITVQYLEKRKRTIEGFRNDSRIECSDGLGALLTKDYISQYFECSAKDSDNRLVSPRCHSECSKNRNRTKLSNKNIPESSENSEEERQAIAGKKLSELVDIVLILIAREDFHRIKGLNTAFCRFKAVASTLAEIRSTAPVTAHLFRLLLPRANFDRFSGNYGSGPLSIAYGEVDCDMQFTLCGSHILFIRTEAFTHGNDSIDFYPQSVEFRVPALDIQVIFRWKERQAEEGENLSRLSAITEEIQKCIEKDDLKEFTRALYPGCQRHQAVDVPEYKITDDFVVAFFVSLSEISYAFHIGSMEDKNYVMFTAPVDRAESAYTCT